jgi:hypothetical protein
MKKYILLLICISFFGYAKAGDGDTFFSFSGGALYNSTGNATLSYEKYTSYHNSYSIDLDYTNDFSKSKKFEDLTIGMSYKKVFRRYKNATLRGVIGGGIGMNSERFQAVIMPSFEYNYTFSNGCQFFVQQKNQIVFWGRDWLRVGGAIGFKIPF